MFPVSRAVSATMPGSWWSSGLDKPFNTENNHMCELVIGDEKGGSAITSSEMRHAVRMGENSTVQFVGGL